MRARRAASQEGRHGDRWERRRLWASTALNDYLDWPGLAQVCCVERTRRHKGKETVDRAYASTSLPPERADAARLLEIWRGHWGIENRLPGCIGCGTWCSARTGEPGANGVGAATAGGTAEPGENLVIGMFRLNGVRNIAAALRHYGWKPWETLALIGLLPNN